MMTRKLPIERRWSSWQHNLALNAERTKEMIFDFRTRSRPPHHPKMTIDSSAVYRVTSTKVLGITADTQCGLEQQHHCHHKKGPEASLPPYL